MDGGGVREAVISSLCALTRAAPVLPLDRLALRLYEPGLDDRDRVISWRGRNLLVSWANSAEWNVYRCGRFEDHVYRAFRTHLRRGGHAIDVGANVGLHTLALSELVGDGGKVLALEPHPLVRRRLLQNLALSESCTNVAVEKVAAAESLGEATFFLPRGQGISGKGRLGTTTDREWDEVQVPVTTLDELVVRHRWSQVDLIKCDVEGFDVAVLRGARTVLETHRPAVVLEYNPSLWANAGYHYADLHALMTSVGYRLWMLPIHRLRGLARPEAYPIGEQFEAPDGFKKVDLLARSAE